MEHPLHHSNRQLPACIAEKIPDNSARSWDEIAEEIRKLTTDSIDVDAAEGFNQMAKKIGTLLKKITIHYNLKYHISDEQLMQILSCLLHLYSKPLSIPFKIRVLDMMTRVLKRDLPSFVFTTWRQIWAEALSIAKRENKSGPIANEQANVQLLTALVTFLHAARNYIAPTEAPTILEQAMSQLSELRLVTGIEGLLLLVNCLPTAQDNYDELLPRWIKLWDQISNNPYWDCFWLTLLCRARKHTSKFDWLQLAPALAAKARELFQLPSLQGKPPSDRHFPFALPAYYVRLVHLPIDARKVAINKIGKLLYFVSMQGPLVHADPISVTPPKLNLLQTPKIPGMYESAMVHAGTLDLVMFLQSVRPYFHPSHTGPWTPTISYFLTTLVTETSRSVAKSIANNVLTSTKPGTSKEMYQRYPLDVVNVKYICGCLLPLVLEMLYGKVPMLLQLSAGCVKNLAAVDPAFGDVIVPFLLSALDPAAVNLSHQAPSAIHALALCFRSFLFPKPIILPYLADILKLSLNGLDPNDMKKSSSTLNLFSMIFAWIPIGAPLQTIAVANAPTYLDLMAGVQTAEPPLDYSHHLEVLAEYTVEWALAFIDKIIPMLEAKEEKQQGKRNPLADAMGIGPLIADAFESVFIAASAEAREKIIDKVLEYLGQHMPKNAAKEWGKLVDIMTWVTPECLPRLLDVLLDDDVKSLVCSVEKLSFRLRVVGAAFRRCDSSTEAHLSLCTSVLAIVSKEELIHNTDKSVRKVASKVKKDILKGKVSFYLRAYLTLPHILGEPNDVGKLDVQWHVPSPESVEFSVSLLQASVDSSMTAILGYVDALLHKDGSAAGEDSTATAKKYEEKTVSLLKLMFKTLRGAAEVLGDDQLVTETAYLPATGKSVLDLCTPANKEYLASVRPRVLHFLHAFQSHLVNAQDANDAIRSFAVSPGIQCAWMKLFESLVTTRMASMKDVETLKKWYSMNKKMSSSVIAKVLVKLTRGHEEEALTGNPLLRREFWIGHDMPTKVVNERGGLQFAIRQNTLSFSSIWASLKQEEDNPFLLCLHHLVRLCTHEYDTLRSKACKVFEKTATRFGSKLATVIKPLLLSLSDPTTSYHAGYGAMALIGGTKGVLKRITGQWDLFSMFVTNLLKCQTMLTAIPEQDKREKLMIVTTALLVKYTSAWHHLPLVDAAEAETLMTTALAANGFAPDGSPATIENRLGLRFDTLFSFTLAHLIGGEFPTSLGLWKWCVTALRTQTGQPSQLIALSGLTKLAHIAVHRGIDPALREQLATLFPASTWTELFSALSSCQPKPRADEDAPQWSKGIDTILSTAEYQYHVLPRSDCNENDALYFSGMFRKEIAALLSNLFILLSPSLSSELAFTETLLDACRALTSSSETEAKAHIATKAEVFAAIVRFCVSSEEHRARRHPVHALLSSFLTEQLEKLSMDLCRVWAEATQFMASAAEMAPDDPIFVGLMDSFRLALQPTTGESAEGFSSQGKALMMTRALIGGDVYSSLKGKREPALTRLLAAVMCEDSVLLFPEFHTSREEIGSILGNLTFWRVAGVAEDTVLDRLRALDLEALAAEVETADSDRAKHALETAALWLEFAAQTTPIQSAARVIPALVAIVLSGTGHKEVDVAALCQDTAVTTVNAIKVFTRDSGGDVLSTLLDALAVLFKRASWRVKGFVLVCTGILLLNNSAVLSLEEKKKCKALFVECFLDSRVELQQAALSSMTLYLATKPIGEIKVLAEAYTKNCDILADREKKKRKLNPENSATDKPEDVLVTTVFTVVSLIRMFPFDLPTCIPPLLTALIRLISVPSVKVVITKAIQDFKRSHQDRWEEFKECFTREQLEDMQGAGALHYFS